MYALNVNIISTQMMRFKIYRAITIIFFLLTLLVNFSPVPTTEQWVTVRGIATMLFVFLFFVCYALLLSIFNYYNEAGWKNVSVIIFLSGNSVFYFLSLSRGTPNLFFNFFILIFYLPFVVAFATMNAQEIKPLAQSFAYLMLIICLLHIVLPFIRDRIDLSVYRYFFNAIFLFPPVMLVLLFHKMTVVSGKKVEDDEQKDGQGDVERHDLL